MATCDQSQADDVPLIIDHHPTHDSNNNNNNINNNNNNNNEDDRLHQLASTQKLVLSVALGLSVCGGLVMVGYNSGLMTISINLIVLSEVFYCGACFALASVIGILASKKKTNRLVITLMVMCILSSALFAVVLIVLSIISFLEELVVLPVCGLLAALLSIRISVLSCRICYKRMEGCSDCSCCDTVAFSDGSVPVHWQPSVTSQSSHLPEPRLYMQQQDQLQHQQQQLLQQQQVHSAYNLTKLSQLSPEQLQYLVYLPQTTPWHHTTVSNSSPLPVAAHIPHLPASLPQTSPQGQRHQPPAL